MKIFFFLGSLNLLMPTSLCARGAIRGIGGNGETGENSFQGSFPPDKVAVRYAENLEEKVRKVNQLS